MATRGRRRSGRSGSSSRSGSSGSGGSGGSSSSCARAPRLNSLWSLWYCVGATAFQVYLTAASIHRFAAYIALPWPEHAQPYFELNAYVGFVGAAVVLLPFFCVACVLRVGNLANDGHQLGSAADVHVLDPEEGGSTPANLGLVRTVWLHSGPTAPLLHLVTAFCLLLPKVLMQAQLIKHAFLPKGELWRTDLDFMLTYKERIVVWSFLASAANNASSSSSSSSSLALASSSPQHDHLPPILPAPPVPSTSPSPSSAIDDTSLISAEFVNYALALVVYAVRYPSVFWQTNKSLSLLFSLQLVLNALQSMLAFTGFAVLYKVRTYDEQDGAGGESAGGGLMLLGDEPFLFGVGVALVVYVVYAVALTSAGCVVYLYAFQKYKTYVAREREKHHISWRGSNSGRALWGYLPHCVALAILALLALSSGPLLYDYMLVYRVSLDGAILACVIGTVMHLFAWIVLWLVLTLKNRWRFRVDPGDGGGLSSSSSSSRHSTSRIVLSNSDRSSLVVLNEGQTYVVHDSSPKSAIMNIVEKAAVATTPQQQQQQQQQQQSNAGKNDDDDIYWLKPKPIVKEHHGSGHDANNHHPSWLRKHNHRSSSSPSPKHKVMFDDSVGGRGGVGGRSLSRSAGTKSPKIGLKLSGKKQQNVKFEDLTDSDEDDDGDYATLRDLPLVREENEDELEKARDTDAGDSDVDQTHVPLLMLADRTTMRNEYAINSSSLARNSPTIHAPVTVHPANNKSVVPGADMPPLTLPTPQSVSSSPSPPGKYNGSETSSGVHSSSSMSENNNPGSRRSSSVDEMHTVGLVNGGRGYAPSTTTTTTTNGWKSLSLQRTGYPVAPPTIVQARRGSQQHHHHDATTGASSPAGSDCSTDSSATLVIRRKQPPLVRPKTGGDLSTTGSASTISAVNPTGPLEPFGRATNMRMTSFTDQPDFAAADGRGVVAWPPNKTASRGPSPAFGKKIGGLNNHQRDSANYSLTSSGDSDTSHQ